MKKSWLDYLAEPETGNELTLEEFEVEDGHIMQGLITAQNSGRKYPVIDGVPVFVENIGELYNHWIEKYKSKIGEVPKEWNAGSYEMGTHKVQSSFSYEWKKYNRMIENYDAQYAHQTGIEDSFYNGKTIMDAGCGYGRHVNYISSVEDTKVVGVDLSEAIFVAFSLLKDKDNVVLAQGDLNKPPVKQVFDFVYSWGVLHHTPSVKKGFESILRYVKPGGQISFNAYRNWNVIGTKIQGFIRFFTCRMPKSLLYYLSYYSVPMNFFYQIIGQYIPGIKQLTHVFIKPNPDWRICHTDTFDWWHPFYNHYHKLGELRDWVKEKKLNLIQDDITYNAVRAELG